MRQWEQAGIHQPSNGGGQCVVLCVCGKGYLSSSPQITDDDGDRGGGGGGGGVSYFLHPNIPFVSPVMIVHTQPRSLGGLSDLLWQGFVFSFVVDFIPFRFKQALNLSH